MKFKLDKLYKKIIVHIAIILSLILLVETFVCNYKHFLKMDGETVTYEMKDMRKYGFQYNISNDCYIVTEDSQVLEIVDINQEITTVYLDFTHLDETVYETKATIYYTDETRLTYASGSKPLKIIPEYENSKYLQEDFFGKTNKFRFQFSLKKGDKVKINCVTFNKKIPFNFSFIRVAAMGVITLGIYLFVMAFHYKDKLLEKAKINKVSKIVVTALSMLLIILVYQHMFNGFANSPLQESGTQISKELVDSFLKGQVSMLEEPTDRFLSIVDPYVPANRNGYYYLWDHVFYKGKFYSYYGITPVIFLFLPFHVLTGYYLYDGHAVLLFSMISTLFLSLTYFKLINKKHKDLPLFLQISGYIILFMSCGILSNIVRPAFYEVATSCAFMFMTLALYHFVSSNILLKDQPIKNNHLLFSSVFLSLAVLSRATYALYAICAVIFIAITFINNRKTFNKKQMVDYLCKSLIPFIVIGSVQCIYNYLRFGSILEFGIKYSLTINDFTKTKFHASLGFNSFYNFLFAFPTVSDSLYFIKPNALTFGASGYYFFETTSAIGLFNRVPLLYMLFYLPFMKTNMNIKEKALFALKYLLPCVFMPILLVVLTWESGFAIRYYSDFAPLMILFILFLFFDRYNKFEERNDKSSIKVLAIIMGVTLLFAFVGQMAIIYDFVPNFGRHIGVEDYRYTYKYYQRARELAFWY